MSPPSWSRRNSTGRAETIATRCTIGASASIAASTLGAGRTAVGSSSTGASVPSKSKKSTVPAARLAVVRQAWSAFNGVLGC